MSPATFHGDDVAPAPPDRAFFHILPVPLEKTVSYGGGTGTGPAAIIEASAQLELFDGVSVPAEHGLYTAAPIDCSGETAAVFAAVREQVSGSVRAGALPVVLGGEHSLTAACAAGIGDVLSDFGVVQFDAHADLRDTYEGDKDSHACVMRRIWERDIPIFQIGTRSFSLEEHELRRAHGIAHTDASDIWQNGIEAVTLPRDFPERIYITFDADCFDAAVMPATGTPVPGGLHWYQITGILERILERRICLGFDLVEYAPQPMLHGTAFTMAQLAYTMMGMVARSEVNKTFYRL